MAKSTIIFEDVGSKTLSFLTEIEGVEAAADAVSPAMAMAMATRAMYENGMLAEAAAVALAGIAQGNLPSECILAHFAKSKEPVQDE